jgi:hypothetical protein
MCLNWIFSITFVQSKPVSQKVGSGENNQLIWESLINCPEQTVWAKLVIMRKSWCSSYCARAVCPTTICTCSAQVVVAVICKRWRQRWVCWCIIGAFYFLYQDKERHYSDPIILLKSFLWLTQPSLLASNTVKSDLKWFLTRVQSKSLSFFCNF